MGGSWRESTVIIEQISKERSSIYWKKGKDIFSEKIKVFFILLILLASALLCGFRLLGEKDSLNVG